MKGIGKFVSGLGVSSLLCAAMGAGAQTLPMLHTDDRNIVDTAGRTVVLRGFNLGGWFAMESYMSPMDVHAAADNLDDTYSVMKQLDASYTVPTERALMKGYQDAWIQPQDFKNIKAGGFNAVRVPIWWGQFFDLDNPTPSGWRTDAFDELDQLVANAAAQGIYVILDMHGVIGGQSNAPSTGRKNLDQFWSNADYQQNTAWMWAKIASHFKGNPTVAGYDLMNEPDKAPSNQAVLDAYVKLYDSIRGADPDHMIFIEDTFGSWSWNMLPAPTQYGWTNVVYEAHEYQWNYQHDTTGAGVEAGADKLVNGFLAQTSWHVPGYVGEFNNFEGGANAWKYSINAFNKAGLSWTMWAYKSSNGVAPNYWGWYDRTSWPGAPDIAHDSSAEIARKWSLWTTDHAFALNSAIDVRPSY